ncbi:MAG: hypothetical protein Kow0029_14930 [Candidatus Rifleibacteriota bacterium]
MIKFDKILVPVDFSEGSELALRYAATFASEYGAQIHLLNVIEEEVLHAGNLSDPLETTSKWEEQSREQLISFVPESFKDLDIVKTVRGGLVHETIIEYAKENDVSLIVIGAHGKSGFIESWLGGTSYEIARKAPCAVLTVKPQGKGFVTPDQDKVF